MMTRMAPSGSAASTLVPAREAVDTKFTWDLASIFADWPSWEAGFRTLTEGIDAFKQFEGTLAQGPQRLLESLKERDPIGQLSYRVWYYPTLHYDQDQRDNTINAKRQQVQLLLARWSQAESWYAPELLRIPVATVREWIDASPDLALYRFYLEDLYRQQKHVLDEAGERLLSLSSRLSGVPSEAYAALSTADARFPTITLSTGETVQVSYGQYRKLLAICRNQEDRRNAYEALYDTYGGTLNTYATLYNGVMQREWFEARARGHKSTLEAALFGNNIPPAVVHNLIRETKAGV